MKQDDHAVKLPWCILQSNSLRIYEFQMYPFVFNSTQWILFPFFFLGGHPI